MLNRPHSITADVEIPDGGAEGVLLCQGTAAGGYSLYVKDGQLHYVHNYVGRGLYSVSSPDPLPDRATTSCASSSNRPANPTSPTARAHRHGCSCTSTATLVADAEAPVTTPFMFNPGALTCGANPGSPVTPDYTSPFRFTGTIHTVTVDVSGELHPRPRSRTTRPHGPPIARRHRLAGRDPGALSTCCS